MAGLLVCGTILYDLFVGVQQFIVAKLLLLPWGIFGFSFAAFLLFRRHPSLCTGITLSCTVVLASWPTLISRSTKTSSRTPEEPSVFDLCGHDASGHKLGFMALRFQ
jgi:hypothetical protein